MLLLAHSLMQTSCQKKLSYGKSTTLNFKLRLKTPDLMPKKKSSSLKGTGENMSMLFISSGLPCFVACS